MSEPLVSVFGGVFAATSIFWSQFEQQKLEDKIDAANVEILILSQKIVDLTTGGEGFCHAGVTVGRLVFANDTDWPLYDVHVRIVDLEAFEKILQHSRERFGSEELDFATLMRTGQNVELGNMSPHSAQVSLVQVPLKNANLRWNLFYTARNGFWMQHIVAGRVGERVEFACRVMRGDKVLLEKIPSEFPRESDDSVAWKKIDRERSA